MKTEDGKSVRDCRVAGNDFIRVACEEDSAFVYVPSQLNKEYLEQVLSDSLGQDTSILSCRTTNLCASVWGKVSHSGATVLRLSVEMDTGDCMDIVAKILCPDSVNLFKLDRDFSFRVAEMTWARWWNE